MTSRDPDTFAGDAKTLLARFRALIRPSRSRGQAMTEFALLAPLLFFVLLGIVDFGKALFVRNELTNAAREGARVAILQSNPCNAVLNETSSTSCGSTAGYNVCDAITNEGELIGSANFVGCSDTSTAAAPPCTSGDCSAYWNKAYVEIDQATTCSPTSTTTTRQVPRGQNQAGNPGSGPNQPVTVTIVYYYRPFDGLVGAFFPSNFYMKTSSCVRPEY
jgi:hypothetical protein